MVLVNFLLVVATVARYVVSPLHRVPQSYYIVKTEMAKYVLSRFYRHEKIFNVVHTTFVISKICDKQNFSPQLFYCK